MQNVPHDEWLELIRRSKELQARAIYDPSLWRELSPLNRRIRALSVLPTTKDTWPTRIIRR